MWGHTTRTVVSSVFLFGLLPILLKSAAAVPVSTVPAPSLSSLNALPVGDVLTSNITAYEVMCGYALSGPYCMPQRALFYAIAIFSFCFRFHKWLTAIGVAYLVSYSTTTGLHYLLLSAVDTDVFVTPLLTLIGWFVAFNFALFTPRTFSYRIRIALFIWGSIFTIPMTKGLPSTAFWKHIDEHKAVQVCSLGAEEVLHCIDTCSTGFGKSMFRSASDSIGPTFLLRSLDVHTKNSTSPTSDLLKVAINLTSSVRPPYNTSGTQSRNPYDDLKQFYGMLVYYLVTTLAVNAIETPRNSRNKVYQYMTMSNTVGEPDLPKAEEVVKCSFSPCRSGAVPDLLPPHRLLLVKFLATLWYIFFALGYAVWPLLFLLAVYSTEIQLAFWHFPEQETPRGIGQWAPWVTVTLTISIALLNRLLGLLFDVCGGRSRPSFVRPRSREVGGGRGDRYGAERETVWWWCVALREEGKDFCRWWREPMRVAWALDHSHGEDEEEEDVGIEAVWKRIERPKEGR